MVSDTTGTLRGEIQSHLIAHNEVVLELTVGPQLPPTSGSRNYEPMFSPPASYDWKSNPPLHASASSLPPAASEPAA